MARRFNMSATSPGRPFAQAACAAAEERSPVANTDHHGHATADGPAGPLSAEQGHSGERVSQRLNRGHWQIFLGLQLAVDACGVYSIRHSLRVLEPRGRHPREAPKVIAAVLEAPVIERAHGVLSPLEFMERLDVLAPRQQGSR
jgi:hypothetical protein